jgi:hypothetical protein
MSGPTNNGDAWMYGVIIIEKVITKRKNLTIRNGTCNYWWHVWGLDTNCTFSLTSKHRVFFSLNKMKFLIGHKLYFSLTSMHRGFFSLWTRWNFNPIMSRSTDGLDGSYVITLCPSPSVFSSYFNKRNFLANWNHIT